MSTIIMTQCWPLQGMNASQKAVLISLADNANDDGVCWPSVAYIAVRTCLSERAVQNAIKFLQEVKILAVEDRNGRSNVYTIKADNYTPNPRKSCTPAESAPPQKESEPPQNLHPTPAGAAPAPANPAPITINNHQGTVIEPQEAPSGPVLPVSLDELMADGVSEKVAKEFLALRKKLGHELTPLALDGVKREAGIAGWSLEAALTECVERSWRGFKAAWVKGSGIQATGNQGEGFAGQDYSKGVGNDGSF